ncbi:STAS domain-containing protein [Streptomyces griseus]|uniref:STAS domain-containing protein n=1 Tax=Streptomyces griseus TaxID=1911 RepID=UPI000840456B|nr:STAS domain-containing protein [Streptomyces griseus]
MTDFPSSPFTLTAEAGPQTVRLRLAGDLDYDTSERLVERAVGCLAADPGPRELLLDCSRLRLCDSMGISALLMVHRATSSRGVGLRLESPPDFLRRILEITGIRELFGSDATGRQSEHPEDATVPAGAQQQPVPPPTPSG